MLYFKWKLVSILIGTILLGLVPSQFLQSQPKALPQAPSPRVKRLSEQETERFIKMLGSEDFRERAFATNALKRRPEAAVYLLRASRTSDNPEAKSRLSSLLPVMMSREGAQQRLARLPEYVKYHQLDRFVETMVACREFVTVEHDKYVRAFVKEVLTAAFGDKKHYTLNHIPEFVRKKDVTARPPIIAKISPAPACIPGAIASDRIEGGNGLTSVALCNGDVDIVSMRECVLLVTGIVRVGIGGANDSVIICLGDVAVDEGPGALIVTAGRYIITDVIPNRNDEFSIIRENDKKFFSNWKMYSTSEAGVTFGSWLGMVWVQSVTPDGPFAKAGVKQADIITSIDTLPVHSLRDANRLLCRATVTWGATDISFIRDEQKRDAIVKLYEW